MSVILISPIFTLCIRLPPKIQAKCKLQHRFPFSHVNCFPPMQVICLLRSLGVYMALLFCAAPRLGPLLTHSVPCCGIISRKERDRETSRDRIGIHKSNKVCSRFRNIILISSLKLVSEICQDLFQLRKIQCALIIILSVPSGGRVRGFKFSWEVTLCKIAGAYFLRQQIKTVTS